MSTKGTLKIYKNKKRCKPQGKHKIRLKSRTIKISSKEKFVDLAILCESKESSGKMDYLLSKI